MSTAPVRRLRATPQAAALLLVAAGGWALTVPRALDMGSTPGTMGLSLAAFLVMWSLMMAAMMLPAVAAVTGLYVRTFTERPWGRTAHLAGGYLLAWAAAGVPLFLLARVADHAPDGSLWPRWLAAAIFATAGDGSSAGSRTAACATVVRRSDSCSTTGATGAAAATCGSASITPPGAWVAAGR